MATTTADLLERSNELRYWTVKLYRRAVIAALLAFLLVAGAILAASLTLANEIHLKDIRIASDEAVLQQAAKDIIEECQILTKHGIACPHFILRTHG